MTIRAKTLVCLQVGTVLLYGVPIVSLFIESQERLCLAQISNTLLKQFSYNEIHNRRVALGITCVQVRAPLFFCLQIQTLSACNTIKHLVSYAHIPLPPVYTRSIGDSAASRCDASQLSALRHDNASRGGTPVQIIFGRQLAAAVARRLFVQRVPRVRLGMSRPIPAGPLQFIAREMHQMLLLWPLLFAQQIHIPLASFRYPVCDFVDLSVSVWRFPCV